MLDANNRLNQCKVSDELIGEFHNYIPRQDSKIAEQVSEDDSAKIMCHLWNILEEDSVTNLSQTVRQSLSFDKKFNGSNQQQHFKCYMANNFRKDNADKKAKDEEPSTTKIKGGSPKCSRLCPKCSSKMPKLDTSDSMPLSQVLSNLKQAASYEKKCGDKLNELMVTQNRLQEQIQKLEERENAGVEMLKKAECIWSCMEASYQDKIKKSIDKHTYLLKELQDIEASANKWRKNKKKLENDIAGINKCQLELVEKTNDKTNISKRLDKEIMEWERKLENVKYEADVAWKSLGSKNGASDIKMDAISSDMRRMQKEMEEESKHKHNKEKDGEQFLTEAREEIQKLSKVLLLKRFENEKIEAQKDNVLTELELQNENFERCRNMCASKEKYLDNKLKKLKTEVESFKEQCIRCHKCTDTIDIRKFCVDCPRCLADVCVNENGQCIVDNTSGCVCMKVKQKLLDNVLGHMHMVLERKSKMEPGKELADSILKCLKRSKNGKLDEPTKNTIRNFILTTVKKSLNLTVVGGAIKTRCELDPETYTQLKLCLDQVKVTKPPHADKGTGIRKKPCVRWGGTSECNCPKGPKNCVCTKKKGLLPDEPTPSAKNQKKSNNIEDNGEVSSCGSEGDLCGVDCAMHSVPSNVGHDVSWNNRPCRKSSQRNVRAVQCSLGPETLSKIIQVVKVEEDAPSKNSSQETTKNISPGEKYIKETLHLENLNNTVEEDQIKMELNNQRDFSKINVDNISEQEQATPARLNDLAEVETNIPNNIIEIQNENGKLISYSVELTNTSSGTIAIALDGNVIDFIKKKMVEDPNIFVYLIETMPGHLRVDFSSTENLSNDRYRITAKKTESNSIILQANKSIFRMQTCPILSNGKTSSVVKIITYKECESKNKINKEINVPSRPTNVLLKVTVQNGDFRNVNAVLTKSLSGNIVLNITPLTTLLENMNSVAIEEKCNKLMTSKEIQLKDNKNNSFHYQSDNLQGVKWEETTAKKENDINFEIKTSEGNLVTAKNNLVVTKSSSENISEFRNIQAIGKNTLKRNTHSKKKYTTGTSCENDNIFHGERMKINNNISKLANCGNDEASQANLKSPPISRSIDCTSFRRKPYIYKVLTKMCEENNTKLTVRVKGENGTYKQSNATLIKTSSGNIALNVNNKYDLDDIRFHSKDYPVMLSKCCTGLFSIDLRSNCVDSPNAVLRKTASDGLLVVVIPPELKALGIYHKKDSANSKITQNGGILKVKLKNAEQDVIEPFALIQLSSSGNYLLVFDKEFENQYRQIIQSYINEQRLCPVRLERSQSGNYIVSLDNKQDEQNALLVKSRSGNFKIIVKNSVFETLEKFQILNKTTARKSEKHISFSKQCNKLPQHFCICGKNYGSETIKNKMRREIKSSSDSYLYSKDKNNILTKSSDVIRKTPSGHFYLIFNKESKKSSINNLDNIAGNTQGAIVMRKTKSGDVFITLNSDKVGKGEQKSLKITPSGNIYILVDGEMKKISKDIPEKLSDRSESGSLMSVHMIAYLKDPRNKAVTTTCNAKPNDTVCDHSKCTCMEYQREISNWICDYPEKGSNSNDIISQTFSSGKCKFSEDSSKTCISSRSYCGLKYMDNKRDNVVSPHITIRSGQHSYTPKIKPRVEENRLLMIESVCPFHKDRYECVSNDLIEISGCCNTEDVIVEKYYSGEYNNFERRLSGDSMEDSLKYLPPQLPIFLRNYNYIKG